MKRDFRSKLFLATIFFFCIFFPAYNLSAFQGYYSKEKGNYQSEYDSLLIIGADSAYRLMMDESYQEASTSYFNILSQADLSTNPGFIRSRIYLDLTYLYGKIDDFPKSIEYARKATKEAVLIDFPPFILSGNLNIATYYADIAAVDTVDVQMKSDSARYYLNISESLAREQIIAVKDTSYYMGAYTLSPKRFLRSLGVVYSNYSYLDEMVNKDYLSAIKNSQISLQLYMKAEYYRFVASRLENMGEIFLKLYESDKDKEYVYALDSARYYASQALINADTLGLFSLKYDVLSDLAKVSGYKGDYKRAYEESSEAYTLIEKYTKDDPIQRLYEAEAKFDTAQAELAAEKQKKRTNIILISGSSIILLIASGLFAVNQKRQRVEAQAAQKVQEQEQKINELINQQEIASLQGVLEGQEKERKRVAIDLHDRLGGMLSMVKLHFSSLEEKIDTSVKVKQKFLSASDLLDQAANEVRMISHDLMSGVLVKFGLLPALEDLCSKINETGEIEMHLMTDNMNGSLDGEQELQVYRIVQELVGNTLKHAKASEISIQLNEYDKTVNLMVEDDGVGFDPIRLRKEAGIGLENLKARVGKLGGILNIDSGKGAGTTISIDIPINNG